MPLRSPARAAVRSRQLLLRLLPAIAALLALIGLGGYLLVSSALRQDADVQRRSAIYIDRTLHQASSEISRNIVNYAKWGEAYLHLHVNVDRHWADDQRNVGSVPFELYGYDGVFVTDAQDQTVYSVIEGVPAQVQAQRWLRGDLARLLADARAHDSNESGVVGVLKVGGIPALVAAATISTGATDVPKVPGPDSILLFVSLLDSHKLRTMSQTYGLPDITLSDQPMPGLQAIPLLGSAQWINWKAPQPGLDLLNQTLPMFIAGVLALLVVLGALLHYALASARELDAQFNALLVSQADLSHSEQRFRDMAEGSSDWLWETDQLGRLTYLSERFTQVTGAAPQYWLGQPLAQLLQPEGQPLAPWLAANRGGTLVCNYQDQRGHARVCRITARAIEGDQGHRGTATDITEEVQAQAEVRHLSLHDSLTGLPNRHHLHQRLEQWLQGPLALLSLDLDRFKPVNDTYGHGVGDQVLQAIAQRLPRQLREPDLVARVGGDEFIIALPGLSDTRAIEALCQRLVEAICQPLQLGEHTVFLGTSIGVALAPANATTAEELLRVADIALYQAKAAGRSTWRFYTEAMNGRLLARQNLEQALRQAMAQSELRLHYQPRYALASGRLSGFEALLRWQHPQRGLLLPEAFLDIAEDCGLIRPLGRWVLAQSCMQATCWPAGTVLVVNLSPGQFGEPDRLLQAVSDALAGSGLPPQRLVLEIGEHVLMSDAVLPTLHELKALGVCLSLDDFGSGAAGLGWLRDGLFERLTLARRFMQAIHTPGADQAIVRATVQLAGELSLSVTAKGVETAEQQASLQRLGCDEAQGHYFSPALPAELLTGAGLNSAAELLPPG
ncbi:MULTISPECIES: EAL domain-containing protein [unclassified Pseudomonas]|uniref:bifunctional diguanylate cyclase/phosphodiesterase n=1 Tax=unclassified Pseudomonas TaxID=196821 RepID=UPI000BD111DD|nr:MULTISPECIES: EAL domain-containing protein [unclassified Pseudomonas]PVZ20203.1 PAS domain S-box-containing protein/diguanylate cyclase (GGDEF)-like protein [Pseudomonas sp. URIL14HWK12:I12]PVZ27269.1 PAS domain S-box-containing protein/diguanylate cyclase (GGDEF)-like protein [Pseudomonas sp. URIL14HWK12:I10]PVZ38158.1 PAS domain S-box-containing protein/diguanylate cyclase (GGDEF)-like protein [Pseudomonas sp. URIL14HWK12:I11]SNZ04386.1 PAS domain S-box-containing protein/diguanylate cycl